MNAPPTPIAYGFGVSLLLALMLLLGSCRSERVVFAFQPAAHKAASAESISTPSTIALPVVTPLVCPAMGTLAALSRHHRQARPLPARRAGQPRRPATSQQVASPHPRPVRPLVSRHSWARRSPHRVADMYERWFYTGLIGLGIGLLCLIAALIFWSGLLVLSGLGVLLLGLFLVAYGYKGDGHYSFG